MLSSQELSTVKCQATAAKNPFLFTLFHRCVIVNCWLTHSHAHRMIWLYDEYDKFSTKLFKLRPDISSILSLKAWNARTLHNDSYNLYWNTSMKWNNTVWSVQKDYQFMQRIHCVTWSRTCPLPWKRSWHSARHISCMCYLGENWTKVNYPLYQSIIRLLFQARKAHRTLLTRIMLLTERWY